MYIHWMKDHIYPMTELRQIVFIILNGVGFIKTCIIVIRQSTGYKKLRHLDPFRKRNICFWFFSVLDYCDFAGFYSYAIKNINQNN